MYTTLFMGKVSRKNPDINKDKTDVMFGLTLHDCIFHFPLCTSQGIKVPFDYKSKGLAHWSLVTMGLSFFLSLILFSRLNPWSTVALCVQFPAWASKTWMGRCSASSLSSETGRVLAAYVNRASPLSWGFIGFLCKPQNISLFLSSIFSTALFFPNLSLYL